MASARESGLRETPLDAAQNAREGRAFAVTLAVGFLFLALIGYWKDIRLLTTASLSLMAAFLLASIILPRRLGPFRAAWMTFGEILGRITTPVLMAIVYYVVITPIGIVRRAVTARPGTPNTYWHRRPPPSPPSRMERQF